MKIYIRADWYEDEIEPFLSADPYESSTGYSDYDEYELYDYSEYEDFYHQILRRKIFVPLKVVKDIPDYNAYRKALFNTLYLSMQSGESIETLYAELSSAFPGIIKEDANNRADMLIEIVDATLYAQSLVSPISASKGDMYMKRYVRADANYFTIKGWVNTPYPYPTDVDYVVIEHKNGDLIWEGNSWDLPEEYYPLNIQDEEYDGAGLCIITVK